MRVLASEVDTDLLLSNTGEDRPEGLHLSEILSRMAWEKDRKYNPDAEKDLMIFEQGHTWEAVLERALATRHQNRAGYRPEPMVEDGIWLSPDWISPDGDIQHEEWKSTRKSLNKADEKIAEWASQSKAYVRALLRRRLIKRSATRFRVWFIMGDWSFESKGDLSLLRDYYRIDIEWSQRELDEGWSGILSYARRTGLLKEAKPWDDRPRLNRTMAARAKNRPGSPRPRSRAKAQIATFPSGRSRNRSSAGS